MQNTAMVVLGMTADHLSHAVSIGSKCHWRLKNLTGAAQPGAEQAEVLAEMLPRPAPKWRQ